MRNSKDILRQYFSAPDSRKNVQRIAECFISEKENSLFEKELFVTWNELPEFTDRKKALQAHRRFKRSVAPSHKHQSSFGRWILNISAAFALPLLLWSLFLKNETGKPDKWIETFTEYGQMQKVELPDESVVWLNAGSKIIYPEEFNKKIRQVFVTGEVYVEVANERKRPFFLSAGHVDIRVLGTKFNIKSYPEQENTEVSLIEGSIELGLKSNGHIRNYQMSAGSFLSFHHDTGAFETECFSPNDYVSWSEESGGLYFRNIRFEEIVRDLERKFNVKIIIRDEKLKHERYYASFVNNESLEDILKHFNMNNMLIIQKKADVIDISCK